MSEAKTKSPDWRFGVYQAQTGRKELTPAQARRTKQKLTRWLRVVAKETAE